MAIDVTIGEYVVREPREVTRCPSYYAADWERLRLKPGRYPVRLRFEGGYGVPMPYWLLARIDATRVAGATYSGFGGVNFASHELLAGEAVAFHLQSYDYELPTFVAQGTIELLPGCEWALDARARAMGESWTWDTVRAMAEAGASPTCA